MWLGRRDGTVAAYELAACAGLLAWAQDVLRVHVAVEAAAAMGVLALLSVTC
jgi:hypothetical protein